MELKGNQYGIMKDLLHLRKIFNWLNNMEILKRSKIYGLLIYLIKFIFRVLTKGHIFGEYALFSNDPRSASIVVDKEGTELLTIDKRDFNESIIKLKEIMESRKHFI